MRSGTKFVKGILPTFFCLLTLLLVGCGGAQQGAVSTTRADDSKQVFIWPSSGNDLKTIDPALSTDGGSIAAIDLVFTGLLQLDNKLQIHDQLAASHSVSSDGLIWTFKLRPNLKFSDGTPLTSADVAYSIDRALQPRVKSAVALTYMGLIKGAPELAAGKVKTIIGDGILTPDPDTVVIITTQKASYFLEELTYSCSYVIEKGMIEKYGDLNFVDHLSQGIGGAGPFMVSKYEHGKAIEFVPNPHYYGPKPQLKKIVIPFYKQADTIYKAYQTGQVDQSNVPSAHIDAAKALPEGQFHSIPQLWITYYGMNYLVKPFNNIKIRQAFALAINKETLAHNTYKDKVIATNHIVPQGMPGYDADLTGPAGVKSPAGDPKLAKQLLEEGMKDEGYTASTFPSVTFTVATNGSSDTRNELQAVQQMWQSVLGISVKLNDIDYGKLLSDVPAALNNPNGVQMFALGWVADYPDPQDWLTLQFDKGSPNNVVNYGQNHSANASQQQETQKLMEQADSTQDQAQRMKLYNQAEQQLVNDVVWLPTVQVGSVIVRKPCVVGIADNAQSMIPPDDWTNIYISTATPCADTSQY
ncbi:peptide ABC transporter substrate-binding protein [Ktedonobacter robiniae]|uniref:ABC transporter substrate-binding protein n=1 Tax=Ktedonobacter robiniae TaxID=2778365 RepID=A0ABQ3UUE1_9CHLR|nr:peptide ABC transporter substrate-binding protein [Ktedonobacter robiniae]GHO56464.1 ABC transporter substrate-binding protein [Ktedonobacter robiniae]